MIKTSDNINRTAAQKKSSVRRFFRNGLTLLLSALLMMPAMPAVLSFAADYSIESCWWDDESVDDICTARWDKAKDKTSYRVQLYRGTAKVGKSVTTSKDRYDFTALIAEKNSTGNYYFEVTPIKGGADSMVRSDSLEVDSDVLSEIRTAYTERKKVEKEERAKATPGWRRNPDGSWQYGGEDGNWVVNNWVTADGSRYYMNSKGMMVTGWNVIGGKWYYFDENSGALYVSRTTPDGYEVNENGVWVQNGQEVVLQDSQGRASNVNTSDIGSLTLSISEGNADPGVIRPVSVSCSSGAVIDGVSYSIPAEEWKAGYPVIITAQVSLKEAYNFASDCKFKAGGAILESVSGTGRIRSISCTYYPKVKLAEPRYIHVSGGELVWDKVPNAKRYRVRIKEGSETVYTAVIDETRFDISDYTDMYQGAVITAMGGEKQTSYYLESNPVTIEDLESFAEQNSFDGILSEHDGVLSYKDDTGMKMSGWYQLLGSWYHFRSSGIADGPGWYKDAESGLWYYFDTAHRMVTGWIEDGGVQYFLNDGTYPEMPSGAWVEQAVR